MSFLVFTLPWVILKGWKGIFFLRVFALELEHTICCKEYANFLRPVQYLQQRIWHRHNTKQQQKKTDESNPWLSAYWRYKAKHYLTIPPTLRPVQLRRRRVYRPLRPAAGGGGRLRRQAEALVVSGLRQRGQAQWNGHGQGWGNLRVWFVQGTKKWVPDQ